jgi:hypothetical protein
VPILLVRRNENAAREPHYSLMAKRSNCLMDVNRWTAVVNTRRSDDGSTAS